MSTPTISPTPSTSPAYPFPSSRDGSGPYKQAPSTGSIKRLPRDVAEKIAAGEVIERPVSVVKELVENAVDAGAFWIRVSLEAGGLRTIAVEDNGAGIPADDMLLAIERHTTSKIDKTDDLWALTTLGFRGEALASIAAISHMTIESRTKGHPGRLCRWESTTLREDAVLPAPALQNRTCGTRVTAEHLFFNMPARLKFMKARASEVSLVRDLLQRLSLTHPEVHFSLLSDDRKLMDLPSCSTLEERVAQVFDGPEDQMESFYRSYDSITVSGCWDRHTRAQQSKSIYLAVNGRMLRDRALMQATISALRPVMMEGEFPRIFLDIHVPPEDVDVNVHPAKAEVRFRRSRDVFSLIHATLSELALTQNVSAYRTKLTDPLPSDSAPNPHPPMGPTQQTSLSFTTGALFAKKQWARPEMPPMSSDAPLGQSASETILSPGIDRAPTPWPPRQEEQEQYRGTALEPPNSLSAHHFASWSLGCPAQYIGQIKNTYLIFQDAQGMILVDQHAAHERIRYEELKAQLFQREGKEAGCLEKKALLIPMAIPTSPEGVETAQKHSELLESLGFEVDCLGASQLVLRTIPAALEDQQARPALITLLEALLHPDGELSLSAMGDPTRWSPTIERMVATTACHSSVRAGQSLSETEARGLYNRMLQTPAGLNCPHGRPASLHLSFSQIEGLFKRSGASS